MTARIIAQRLQRRSWIPAQLSAGFASQEPGLRKPATAALVSSTELELLFFPVQGYHRFIRNWRLSEGSNSIRIVAAGPPGQNKQMSGCVLQQRTDKIIAQIQRDMVQTARADL